MTKVDNVNAALKLINVAHVAYDAMIPGKLSDMILILQNLIEA